MAISQLIIRCERLLVYEVAGFPDTNLHYKRLGDDDVCSPRPNHKSGHYSRAYPVFYWSEQQFDAVFNICSLYIPICSTFFAGIYSDKYGGKNAVLLGLVLCVLVTSASYLVILHNDYVFFCMLLVRKIAEGMMIAAVCSLAGKWAIPGERTAFVGILLEGKSLGHLLGGFLIRRRPSWNVLCYINACICFVTAVCWWILFRFQYIPKPKTFKIIPWKSMAHSTSPYVLTLLILSCTLIVSTSEQLLIYASQELYLDVSSEQIVEVMVVSSETLAYFLCASFSDYIVSQKLLSSFALGRTITCALFPIFYCTLLMVKAAGCSLETVLACCVMLHFVSASFLTTVNAIALEVTSAYSGVVFAILLWFSHLFDDKIRSFLSYVSGIKFSFKSWSELFLMSAVVATLLSLPFIFCGIKKTTWGNGVRQEDKNLPLESASKDVASVAGNISSTTNTKKN
ncbi:uncharacterized protein LOC128995758 [Macrosteles quadrilineatus]|uniref:uncharacterized protein LOC128995758 n=1 Tax=Macrosteles quadrilineatus TaxID=74068 RepID=UPI0023E2D6A0|nr:uncharacterized protein LOC128995758 [Macrosteles quadrilineatus]